MGYELEGSSLEEAHAFNRDALTKAGWKIEKDEVDKALGFSTLVGTKLGFVVNLYVSDDPRSDNWQVFGYNYGNVDTRLLPRFGSAKPVQNTFQRTSYETDAKLDDVAAFTRAELQKLGWREVDVYGGVDPTREPGKSEPIHSIQRGIGLDTTIEVKEGKVEVAYNSRVLALELPIFPETTKGIELMESPVHLFYTAKTNLDEAIAYYRQELPPLGWEMSKEAEITKDGSTRLTLTSPDKKPYTFESMSHREGFTSILITNLQKD